MMLLDSNIVIYAAAPGYDEVRQFIITHDLSISVISKIEVLGYHKLTTETRQDLKDIFQLFSRIKLSEAIIDRAISLRQKRKMSLGDAVIAATALIHGLAVVTANVKDFNWINGLEIINPVKQQ